jgi:formate hydrogenlyase subunit 3/multisubunit Na+/H+ antiporter MnhD subunit
LDIENVLILIIILFVYTILSIIVGFWSEKKKRSYWLWLIISFVITPFISALILKILGEKNKNIK